MGETETNTKKKKPSPLWFLFPAAALLFPVKEGEDEA